MSLENMIPCGIIKWDYFPISRKGQAGFAEKLTSCEAFHKKFKREWIRTVSADQLVEIENR